MTGAIVWLTTEPQIETWTVDQQPASGGTIRLKVTPCAPCTVRRVDIYSRPPGSVLIWWSEPDAELREGDTLELDVGLSI